MAMVSTIAAYLALGWAVLAAGLGGVAVFKRWRQMALLARRYPAEPAGRHRDPVLLIRPCAGAEPTLERCLLSVLETHHSGPLEVVFGVSEADDRAVPTIERVRPQLHARGIETAFEVHAPRGPNRKASILAGVCEARNGHHDVVINADSNADLTGFDLDALVEPLRTDPHLGALWAPPSEEAEQVTLGNRASIAVLTGSLHAFGLLAGIDPEGLVGKLFAVRETALRQVGGFGAFTDYLGEDAELSRRLRADGLDVLPVAQPVRAISNQRSILGPVARHARWMAVIRAQRPALLVTYPLFFFGTPAILALSVLGLRALPMVAIAAAALAIAGRLLISLAARRYSRRAPGFRRAMVDAMLADLVLLLAFGRALRSTRFTWRGHPLRITRGGKLVADDEPTGGGR